MFFVYPTFYVSHFFVRHNICTVVDPHVLTDHVSLIDFSEEMSHTGSYTARGYCLSAPRLPAVIVQMLAFVVKDLFLDEFLFQESASIGLVSLSPNE